MTEKSPQDSSKSNGKSTSSGRAKATTSADSLTAKSRAKAAAKSRAKSDRESATKHTDAAAGPAKSSANAKAKPTTDAAAVSTGNQADHKHVDGEAGSEASKSGNKTAAKNGSKATNKTSSNNKASSKTTNNATNKTGANNATNKTGKQARQERKLTTVATEPDQSDSKKSTKATAGPAQDHQIKAAEAESDEAQSADTMSVTHPATGLSVGLTKPSQDVAVRNSGSHELSRSNMIPIIEYVLHGPVDRTFDEVIAEAGLAPDQGLLLWRILGFDDSSADGLMFNKTDVDALKAFQRAVDREMLTLEDMLEMVRAIAQTTSRLASWQSTIIGRRLDAMGVASPDSNPSDDQVLEVINSISGLRPILERLLVQIWRRQTVDNILRADRANAKPHEASDSGTVAFADMVGFTRISRDIEQEQLARLVERFEQVVTLIAAETGVKLMKTIGDEVLIMGVFPQEVAEFALSLQQFTETADEFPELRIGIATGPLISQMGDVFGETVNRASRLTAMAKPSSSYVDTETHEALMGIDDYRFKSTRMRAIQGFNRMTAWELRRAKGA